MHNDWDDLPRSNDSGMDRDMAVSPGGEENDFAVAQKGGFYRTGQHTMVCEKIWRPAPRWRENGNGNKG
eukprot:10756724-Prorocentrum_lima.AAC.1